MYINAFVYVQRVPKGGTQFHTCLLERLQPGQVMLSRVRACNSVGASEWSEDTHFRTPHSATPGPACVTLNSATHSSLHISWTAAPAPSGAHEAQAVEYVVQFRPLQRPTRPPSRKDSACSERSADVHAAELHIASESCSASQPCLSPGSSPRRHFASAPGTSDGSCGTPSQHDELGTGAAHE